VRTLNIFYRKYARFIKFGLVGLSNTTIALIIYYVVIIMEFHYQIANIAAFVISSLSGFILNRAWVFKAKHKPVFMQAIKYYVVYGSSLAIGMALSHFWIEIVHFGKYIVPLLNLCFSIPYNYLFNKMWAFNDFGE